MKQFTFSFNGYDITGITNLIIGAIISAIISGVVSYFFSRRREKSILKLKTQIDTADRLQEFIKDNVKKTSQLRFLFNFDLFTIQTPQMFVQNLNAQFDEWEQKYREYNDSVLSILLFIELRESVLIHFRVFHREVSNTLRIITEKNEELRSFRFKIIKSAMQSTKIDETVIKEFNNVNIDLQELKLDIESYFLDMQIELQNEFYHKLSFSKIRKRKPVDPTCKVITAQKSKASILEGDQI